jgi:hypothetical protein
MVDLLSLINTTFVLVICIILLTAIAFIFIGNNINVNSRYKHDLKMGGGNVESSCPRCDRKELYDKGRFCPYCGWGLLPSDKRWEE